MKRQPLSIGKAIPLALVMSIILAPLVLIGPFVAGFVARARMGGKGLIIGPAILPAILWAAAWYFLVNHPWQIGKELVTPAVLGLTILSPITAISFIAGSIAGGGPTINRLVGLIMIIGCGIWLSGPVKKAVNLYNFATSDSPAPGRSTQTNTCESHLKKLFNALQQYSDAYDGMLPPSDRWVSALQDPAQSFVSKEEASFLNCPQAGGKGGYAMNKELSGIRIKTIANLAGTPLLFDSSLTGIDATDKLESLPNPGRHGGKNHVLNLDGSISSR